MNNILRNIKQCIFQDKWNSGGKAPKDGYYYISYPYSPVPELVPHKKNDRFGETTRWIGPKLPLTSRR
jgi:hypothetical protein